jgi:two-component system sensor histidine kinase ChvG
MATSKSNNQSILKKFLVINFIVFLVIGVLTLFYLNTVKPTLIKNKTASHIKIIDNTTENIDRLKINFSSEDIREFLFSTKFLFQSIDRVQIFDSEFNLLGDTDTLDLDPNAFSRSLNIIEMSDLNNQSIQNKNLEESNKSFESKEIFEDLKKYSYSSDYGKPLTYSKENYDQFLLVTVKNVVSENKTIGYLAITENANEIKVAIDERRNFIIRTALLVALVILIFSYVLNRYFLKPIKNLVQYTNIIKNKSKEKTNIGNIKKRIATAENYSTDLLHEIRNPLASLKSASEIISETNDKSQRNKLINIVSHDVERIERLITDYSQMLRDEAAISSEKMQKLNLKEIAQSVVDDFNSIYETKKSIGIKLKSNGIKNYSILGIENRIEQIIANLLENSISFSENNQEITVEISKDKNDKIKLVVVDQGSGFSEKDTNKIFNRFYSNRPENFGEHSGLGLNIVKNLVEIHGGEINASNNKDKGARIEIIFPEA